MDSEFELVEFCEASGVPVTEFFALRVRSRTSFATGVTSTVSRGPVFPVGG